MNGGEGGRIQMWHRGEENYILLLVAVAQVDTISIPQGP